MRVCFLRWSEHRTSSLKRQNQLSFEIDCHEFFQDPSRLEFIF